MCCAFTCLHYRYIDHFWVPGIFTLFNPLVATEEIKPQSLSTCWQRQTLWFMYLYLLVRAVDHGDQHVEENHHHGDVIDAIQDVADVLDELMVVLEHHWDHFRQPEYWPEKSFETLLHSARIQKEMISEALLVNKYTHAHTYLYLCRGFNRHNTLLCSLPSQLTLTNN